MGAGAGGAEGGPELETSQSVEDDALFEARIHPSLFFRVGGVLTDWRACCHPEITDFLVGWECDTAESRQMLTSTSGNRQGLYIYMVRIFIFSFVYP